MVLLVGVCTETGVTLDESTAVEVKLRCGTEKDAACDHPEDPTTDVFTTPWLLPPLTVCSALLLSGSVWVAAGADDAIDTTALAPWLVGGTVCPIDIVVLFVSSIARFFLRLLLEDDMDDEACKGDDDDGRCSTKDDLLSTCENELDTAT